jgi:hypothetical protein
MSELLDAEAMKNAAKAVFAKANEGNLKPETIESLWPSQHYPHWDGLAEAAVRAYLSAAPSLSPDPGVVEELLIDLATRPIIDGINYRALFRDFQERALSCLSQPAKGLEGGGHD